MAAKTKKRSPKRQLKLWHIEIDGHKMGPELHAKYLRCLEDRRRTNAEHGPAIQEEYALGDTINELKPSRRKDVIFAAYNRILAAGHTTMQARDWPWFSHGISRNTGCSLLLDIANELDSLARELRAYRGAIMTEEDRKVQDWMQLDAHLKQAGQVIPE